MRGMLACFALLLVVLPAYAETAQLAGLTVHVWRPPGAGAHPLVVFSHGYRGSGSQSRFLTQALADAGYLVVAPDHQDSRRERHAEHEPNLRQAASWTDAAFRERGDDVRRLLDAMRADPAWSRGVDWSRVALAGHSLGGYTVLGLAGAWPSWKLKGIKAVLALSPYVISFVSQRTLHLVDVPVMYQTGTRDLGIFPSVKRPGGAYDQTAAPCFLVTLQGVGHFGFSDLVAGGHETIVACALAFLDRYVKGDATADPAARRPGVTELRAK